MVFDFWGGGGVGCGVGGFCQLCQSTPAHTDRERGGTGGVGALAEEADEGFVDVGEGG